MKRLCLSAFAFIALFALYLAPPASAGSGLPSNVLAAEPEAVPIISAAPVAVTDSAVAPVETAYYTFAQTRDLFTWGDATARSMPAKPACFAPVKSPASASNSDPFAIPWPS